MSTIPMHHSSVPTRAPPTREFGLYQVWLENKGRHRYVSMLEIEGKSVDLLIGGGFGHSIANGLSIVVGGYENDKNLTEADSLKGVE